MTKEQMDVRYKMFGMWIVRRLIEGQLDSNTIVTLTDAALDMRLVDLDSNDNLVPTKATEEDSRPVWYL